MKRLVEERKRQTDEKHPSVLVQVGETVRRKLHFLERVKIKHMWSTWKYQVIGAPSISGGPYLLKKIGEDRLVISVTGSEITRAEEEDL